MRMNKRYFYLKILNKITECSCASINGPTSCFKEMIFKQRRPNVKLGFNDLKTSFTCGDQ